MSSNWSDLPYELLDLVSQHFTVMNDLVCLGAACVSWQLFFKCNRNRPLPRKLRPQPPVLLVPDVVRSEGRLYCIFSQDERLEIRNIPHAVLPRDGYSYSTNCGLCLFSDLIRGNVYLFNPFLSINNKINLPSFAKLKPKLGYPCFLPDDHEPFCFWIFIDKVVLSANPTLTSDYSMMILSNRKLAFYRPGEDDWTPVSPLSDKRCFRDVIHFKGEYYAVDDNGLVVAIDIRVPYPSLREVARAPMHSRTKVVHLVESLGQLLLIKRFFKNSPPYSSTIKFKVFKLVDPRILPREYSVGIGNCNLKWKSFSKNLYWVEMKTLDGECIYLGQSYTFSISGVDFPHCKPNNIYFTDEIKRFLEVHHDFGVFNIQNGNFEQCPMTIPCKCCSKEILYRSPIWLEPTLLGARIG